MDLTFPMALDYYAAGDRGSPFLPPVCLAAKCLRRQAGFDLRHPYSLRRLQIEQDAERTA
jgi:hypothetical protein